MVFEGSEDIQPKMQRILPLLLWSSKKGGFLVKCLKASQMFSSKIQTSFQ
jgi:hypothetical protein